MKKLFMLTACLALALSLFSQSGDANKGKDKKQFIYCEIVGTGRLFSNKVVIEIDFGQATKYFEDTRLRDENGNLIKFNSMVDAMNWMGDDGWEFCQAYVITSGQQNIYHWLLKKEVGKLTDEEKGELMSKLNTDKPDGE